MKKNIGTTDRILRVILALIIVILLSTKAITGVLALIAGILAVILVGTALIGWCGVYTILGINTIKQSDDTTKK